MTEKPRRTESKPTKAEVLRRIDITESLLIDCATVTDTLRYFAEKEGLVLARRTVERYREIAEKRIVESAEPARSNERRKARVRLERCFARSMSGRKPNVFAAIAAQKAINTLLGLDASNDGGEEMSVERLAQQIVLQRKELERAKRSPNGLRNEILELVRRYEALGQNPNELFLDSSKRTD